MGATTTEHTEQDAWAGHDLESLFRREALRLVRLAYLLGAHDPEDVAQEAFCRLMQARSRLNPDEDPGRYLTTIVVNEIRDRHRHRLVGRRREHLVSAAPAPVDPGQMVASRHTLMRHVCSLSVRQREVVVLRFWSDLSLADVAAVTGLRLSTTKSHLRRALDALRTLMEEEDRG